MKSRGLRFLTFGGVVALTMPIVTWAAALRGAIFTTDQFGTRVNANVYLSKPEVYLDGGPGPNAPATAAGLPDGVYVFQVTDPPGKVLLSTDPAACRQFTVRNGVVIGTAPSPSSCAHTTNMDQDHNEIGAKTVQLCAPDAGPPSSTAPYGCFIDTPNPGGVYKAWVTPVESYQARGGNLNAVPQQACIGKTGRVSNTCNSTTTPIGAIADPGFGPPRDQVKTDNFKVREFNPPEVNIQKFEDVNGNGIKDGADRRIGIDICIDLGGRTINCPPGDGGGWPITITEPLPDGTLVSNSFFTPHRHIHDINGPVAVCEGVEPGWTFEAVTLDGAVVQATQVDGLYCINVDNLKTQSVEFLNFHNISIRACKTDEATNGPVAGYPLQLLSGSTVIDNQVTGADGCYTWQNLGPLPTSYYEVREGNVSGWTAVSATSFRTDSPPVSGKSYSFSFVNRRVVSQGRWTGGGSSGFEVDGAKVRVTQGMELHCSATALPNNIEINWKRNGQSVRFHLDALTSVYCYDNPSFVADPPPGTSFDTIVGTGTGSYNGQTGATIKFTMTDHGEPGTSDTAYFRITVGSQVVLDVTNPTLNNGNLQAHSQ